MLQNIFDMPQYTILENLEVNSASSPCHLERSREILNLKSYLLFYILATSVEVDLSKNILKIKEAAVDRK